MYCVTDWKSIGPDRMIKTPNYVVALLYHYIIFKDTILYVCLQYWKEIQCLLVCWVRTGQEKKHHHDKFWHCKCRCCCGGQLPQGFVASLNN